jgi:repressor LexA
MADSSNVVPLRPEQRLTESDGPPASSLPALAPRQRDTLQAIERSLAERGYPPTIRELCGELGVGGTNAVSDLLDALERKGYIAIDRKRTRALRVLRRSEGAAVKPIARDYSALRRPR